MGGGGGLNQNEMMRRQVNLSSILAFLYSCITDCAAVYERPDSEARRKLPPTQHQQHRRFQAAPTKKILCPRETTGGC